MFLLFVDSAVQCCYMLLHVATLAPLHPCRWASQACWCRPPEAISSSPSFTFEELTRHRPYKSYSTIYDMFQWLTALLRLRDTTGYYRIQLGLMSCFFSSCGSWTTLYNGASGAECAENWLANPIRACDLVHPNHSKIGTKHLRYQAILRVRKQRRSPRMCPLRIGV